MLRKHSDRAATNAENAVRNGIAEKFLRHHILQWIPSFTHDMEEAADSLLYKTVARTTKSLLDTISGQMS
jgi:TorA maturation chaperone TorD